MPAGRGQPRAVARVLERVTATARRHGMFTAGETVLVACSGGPDSMCLLNALNRLTRLLRIRLEVFHFDHGLREESRSDADYVTRQAGRLSLPVHVRTANDRPAPGESVEAWARVARYGSLATVAADTGASRAALGHTTDDQAETVLMGMVRGGGLEAVAGMPPVATLPPLGFPAVRPLIETTREETEAFCRALRLRPRDDPMNADRRFLRARIRHEVLPLLEERLDRNLRATLARTAEHVRGDAEYLEEIASEEATLLVEVRDDEVRIEAAGLAALPRPVAIRVVRQAVRVAAASVSGGWDSEAGAVHLEGVLGLATGRPGRRLDLPGDLAAERRREYVRLSRPSPRDR